MWILSKSIIYYHNQFIKLYMLHIQHKSYESLQWNHMDGMTCQITGKFTVCSTASSGVHQIKHQILALLACVRGIHRWPVGSPHKGPVTQKMFLFDDVTVMYDTDIFLLWKIHVPIRLWTLVGAPPTGDHHLAVIRSWHTFSVFVFEKVPSSYPIRILR